MEHVLPLWRSMLFVPANVPKFIHKAPGCGADALILDLEDSVPAEEKVSARQRLPDAAVSVAANGADVVVRINSSLRQAAADLEVAVGAAVQAICVPKVRGASQLQWICESIGELEVERGLPVGHTRLVALIESPQVLSRLDTITGSTQRLVAMTLGPEDFSAAVGMEPEADGLLFPNQQIVFTARSAGILPLGFVGSIGQYGDLPAFRETIRRSRRLGLRGGFCVHPDQVAIMNEEFAPSDEEVAEARAVLAAYEQALRDNRGSVRYQGKMIDAPVVARAREVLASHGRIVAR